LILRDKITAIYTKEANIYRDNIESAKYRILALMFRKKSKIENLIELKKTYTKIGFLIDQKSHTSDKFNTVILVKNSYMKILLRKKFINILKKVNYVDKEILKRLHVLKLLRIDFLKLKINYISIYLYSTIKVNFNLKKKYLKKLVVLLYLKLLYLKYLYSVEINNHTFNLITNKVQLFNNIEIKRRILRKFYTTINSYSNVNINIQNILDIIIKSEKNINNVSFFLKKKLNTKNNDFNIFLKFKDIFSYRENLEFKYKLLKRYKKINIKLNSMSSKF